MTQTTPEASGWRNIGAALLVFGGTLLFLFFRSLSPELVLFANDAPLGLLKTAENAGFGPFSGVWAPLNWLGQNMPSAFPNVSNLWFVITGPVGFVKSMVPIALLILGLAAWTFFRQLGFRPWVCVMGGLAAMLSTDPFSYACWGLSSVTISMAAMFLALAAGALALRRQRWAALAASGLAVGFSISEGYDVGAILSLYIAAFVFFGAWQEGSDKGRAFLRGAGRVAVVALFAAFLAAQSLSTLVSTQIQGIVGTQQDPATRQMQWDRSTMWSLPKIETLRVVVPGLFGYRMDTPGGGNYWGAVGQSPGTSHTRHSGSGVYAGLLVLLIAGWAFARSLVKENNPFTVGERQFIWFWTGATVVSLFLAFGRHAPFYQFLYALPYFSTIRNPIKFMHPFTITLVTLFAYGLQGLSRQFLERNLVKEASLTGQLKSWWANVAKFEKRWTLGCGVVFAASVLGWLLYASSRTELIRHLQAAGFGKDFNYPEEFALSIAKFSIGEMGWFVFFFALSLATLVLILSGAFSGSRAKWAGLLLGTILVTDMVRANAPWINYYDYKERYASNPVIDLLRQKPHEHRVAGRLSPLTDTYLAQGNLLRAMYGQQWMQHHFPYYGVQCLDIVQMPRLPELDSALLRTFDPASHTNLALVARLWQLTNTRYQLGMAAYRDLLNQQIDPARQSFRILTNFDFVPRRTLADPSAASVEDFTAALNPQGQHAVFELTNALPRAKLFTRWELPGNDDATLRRLADPTFDPTQTVLLSEGPPAPSGGSEPAGGGNAQILQYEAKSIQLRTQASGPGVLLLNDKFHPDWKVSVDGKPATLLRANFIMRGVHLPAGEHQVEFRFDPPHATLYVSLAALVIGCALWAMLAFMPDRSAIEPSPKPR